MLSPTEVILSLTTAVCAAYRGSTWLCLSCKIPVFWQTHCEHAQSRGIYRLASSLPWAKSMRKGTQYRYNLERVKKYLPGGRLDDRTSLFLFSFPLQHVAKSQSQQLHWAAEIGTDTHQTGSEVDKGWKCIDSLLGRWLTNKKRLSVGRTRGEKGGSWSDGQIRERGAANSWISQALEHLSSSPTRKHIAAVAASLRPLLGRKNQQ